MVQSADDSIATLLSNPPKYDLVGPTAEDDISRAIARYGTDAVKAAVKTLTKPKRGRKRENDWSELSDVIEADARRWLAGGDPFTERTNYSIARDFAKKNPGHNSISTYKRIERKLGKRPYDRRWFTLVTAEALSRDGVPYAQHIRALQALEQLESGGKSSVWPGILKLARLAISDYERKFGELPPATMSMKEVEEKSRNVFVGLNEQQVGGMFGLRSASDTGRGEGKLGAVLMQHVQFTEPDA